MREFVEHSDLFLAYLSVYFRFLWNQLSHEEQRRILAEQLKLIERELLNLDVSPNMLLALNQTKTFRKKGARKQAEKLVKEFIQRYEDLTQKHQQENLQELFFGCAIKDEKQFSSANDPMWRVISQPLVKVSNNVYFSRIRT